MSFVVAPPEVLDTATTDLASLGATIHSANAVAAMPTTGVLAAAEDEVSAAIAEMFSAHGQVVGIGGSGGNAGLGTPEGTAGAGGKGGLIGAPGQDGKT